MKPANIFIALAFLPVMLCAQSSRTTTSATFGTKSPSMEAAVPAENLDSAVVQLLPEKAEVLYLSPDAITTLAFKTKVPIEDIKVGSSIVAFEYDEDNEVINLQALVRTGRTNLRIIAGGRIYTFILNIITDGRVVYGRTYTFNSDALVDESMAAASSAPVLKPDDVDVVGMTRVIERAGIDPVFAKQQQAMKVYPIETTTLWNNCPVTIKDVSFFAPSDSLVFRAEFLNSTSVAQYLHRKQYRLWVANKEIVICASNQRVQGAMVMPSQVDVVYLVVQGQRLNPHNAWRLVLPAQASSVSESLNRK